MARDTSYSSSATFTPAAASHTNGDVNGGAQVFANAGPAGGRVVINSVTLRIDNATVETTAWTLHLYNAAPTEILDDAAHNLLAADRSSYLGSVAIAQVVDLGDTLWIEAHNVGKQIKLASGSSSVYGYLVNGTTLTPGAVAHVVTLHTQEV